MTTWKRRTVVQGLTVGAAAASTTLWIPSRTRAQSEEISLLGIMPFTGPLADAGPNMDLGIQYAIEEFGGEVIGLPIKYVTRDSETKADIAARRTEEAIDTDGSQFVVGPWSSGVALAVSEVAKRRKVLHYFSGGTEEIAGGRCHRYSFQWAASPYTAMHVVMDEFLKANPEAKRWYLFVSDYSFGWSVQKYLEIAGEKQGVEFVGVDRVALGTSEWSNFITKALAAEPDAIGMLAAGNDAILAIREAYNFGLAPEVPIVTGWGLATEDFLQLDATTRENYWHGTNAYYTADTPVAKAFAEGYEEQHGVPPGYAATAAYSMTRIILRAIERADSTEVQDVVLAMEDWETEDWPGKIYIRPDTHQTVRDYFFLECKPESEMAFDTDFARVVAVSSEPQMPDEFNECEGIGEL